MNKRKEQQNCDGMTLIELLVVMLIISILAGIGVGMSKLANQKSARAKAIADMQQISNALNEYRIDKGTYPKNKSLDTIKDDLLEINRELNFEDPWGNEFIYENIVAANVKRSFSFKLFSLGPDGAAATDDDLNVDKDVN